MIQKLYLARHGPKISRAQTNCSNGTNLPLDPPLTALGVIQARELGEYFLSLPISKRPTAIFSSPYYRCLQTSQSVATALGIPIHVEHGLAEWWYPVAPGAALHPRPSSATSLLECFSEIDPSWPSAWYPSRKGENLDELHERIDSFIKAFVPGLERKYPNQHSNILLVGHAATVIAAARMLLNDRHLPLRIGYCSISEFDWLSSTSDPKGHWEPLRLGDGTFLQDGILKDWGFEDIEFEFKDGKLVENPVVPGTKRDENECVGPTPYIISNL